MACLLVLVGQVAGQHRENKQLIMIHSVCLQKKKKKECPSFTSHFTSHLCYFSSKMSWEYFGGKKRQKQSCQPPQPSWAMWVNMHGALTEPSIAAFSLSTFIKANIVFFLFISKLATKRRLPMRSLSSPTLSLSSCFTAKSWLHVTVTVIQHSLWVKYQPLLLLLLCCSSSSSSFSHTSSLWWNKPRPTALKMTNSSVISW